MLTRARGGPQPGTLFRVASVTKTFTGTAVMQLRDAGRLGLDDPAVAYLPELRAAVSPFAPIEAVTIRRMLSHESGLAAEPPGTDWSAAAYEGDAGLTLARAGEITVRLAPNAAHKYSDLAYQLLGEIVTRVSGMPYPQYLRGAVARPAGLLRVLADGLPGVPALAAGRDMGAGGVAAAGRGGRGGAGQLAGQRGLHGLPGAPARGRRPPRRRRAAGAARRHHRRAG
jgi:CubicO group peptidase (beta-lactamase class C family)